MSPPATNPPTQSAHVRPASCLFFFSFKEETPIEAEVCDESFGAGRRQRVTVDETKTTHRVHQLILCRCHAPRRDLLFATLSSLEAYKFLHGETSDFEGHEEQGRVGLGRPVLDRLAGTAISGFLFLCSSREN